MGECNESNILVAFVDFLRLKQLKDVTSSDCISNFFPEFPYQSNGIAGFLCIPLSKNGQDFICFIRREQVKVCFYCLKSRMYIGAEIPTNQMIQKIN